MSDRVRARDYYVEYHGHRIPHLQSVRSSLVKNGCKSFIYLAGDSTLDNKHWLFLGPTKQGADFTDERFTGAACNGYEKALTPPRMVKDVAYWLNHEIAKSEAKGRVACINASIEESCIGERDKGLMAQDQFIRDNIGADDTLVICVGGNDIALKPTLCTILNMASLIFCTSTCCIRSLSCGCANSCFGCGFPLGLGYFIHMFKSKVQDIIERITAKTRPKTVVVCMLYYLDERPGGSWADATLKLLGYNTNPAKLQALIRRIFELATRSINIKGTNVVPMPFFEVLDGKDHADYSHRVEPSVQGGAKMGSALYAALFESKTSTYGSTSDRKRKPKSGDAKSYQPLEDE